MDNRLSDFPPDRFAITAHCPCGHSAQIDYRLIPPDTLVNSLRVRLVCKVVNRDRNDPQGLTTFQLWSAGPDAEVGTEDDVVLVGE